MIRKKSLMIITVFVALTLIFITASCGVNRRPEEKSKANEPKSNRQISYEQKKPVQKPPLPKALKKAGKHEPKLKVYIVQENKVQEMAFEDYVAGVLGGEIKNDWPEEAIKAQAIIARTFVLDFISEKGQSKYKNAHVSTDIEEAQAWNSSAVNDRIRKAVKETRGEVIVYDNKFAKTWFHSNAGGKTATPVEGLNYKEKEPPYIKVVDSPDMTEEVDAEAKKWSAKFSKDKIIAALNTAGKSVKSFERVELGKKGPSGRTISIRFDDTEINAAELRLALGTTDMRSTLLTNIALEGNQVVMSGKGYGHGVGMSQWGAYTMAKQGKKAKDIVNHYFKDVNIVKMWD